MAREESLRGVKVFDDWLSYIHLILGLVAGLMPVGVTVVIGFMFTVYEVVDWVVAGDEPRGDLIEFLVGLLIGGAVKCIML